MRYLILSPFIIALMIFSSCEKLNPEDNGVLVPLTVIEDASLPAININGVLLHSETYGNPSDPMVVVIHGGPGVDYRALLNYRELENDNMFVVFYDQRGSGLSQRLDNGNFHVQFYIDELASVINHYRHDSAQKVVLAGHSWGAMLATAYINQKPDEIAGVILTEPGGFTWEQTKAYIKKSRKLDLFDEFTNDVVYMDQFITGSDHNTLDYKVALSNTGNATTGEIKPAPFWRYGAVCASSSFESATNNPGQMDFTTNLSKYTTKVLFAYSELNTAYGIEHAKLVSSALPNVELVKILDSGHKIPYFGWNSFYPLVQNYLNEIL